ncbi:hypothetical protein HDU99_002561, partial [Rhizoclosmatium hyalinum]
ALNNKTKSLLETPPLPPASTSNGTHQHEISRQKEQAVVGSRLQDLPSELCMHTWVSSASRVLNLVTGLPNRPLNA